MAISLLVAGGPEDNTFNSDAITMIYERNLITGLNWCQLGSELLLHWI